MKIFCDGVWDLFHNGHVKHFKKIKELYDDVYLLVGVMSDEESTEYKRKPFYNEEDRIKFIESCRYVDEVIIYESITEDFINNNNIDLVVHAYADIDDLNKLEKYFDIPTKMNKMKWIDYNQGISTSLLLKELDDKSSNTEYVNEWQKIWEKKGNMTSDNHYLLNGYEETGNDFSNTLNDIYNKLNINESDNLLEIGCGTALYGKEISNKCNYFGIDYSRSLINKAIKLTKCKVYNCEAYNLPFKDNYFDKVFANGCFEYFNDVNYMHSVLKEIDRVAKKGCIIYILNIRHTTRTERLEKHKYDGVFNHTVYTINDFPGYEIKEATFQKDLRFNAYKIKI